MEVQLYVLFACLIPVCILLYFVMVMQIKLIVVLPPHNRPAVKGSIEIFQYYHVRQLIRRKQQKV